MEAAMIHGLQPLTEMEAKALETHEAVIERDLKKFFEVGTALLAIRDQRLYRERYKTWQEYLDIRWGFTRQRAQQLMDAVAVAENVSTIVDITSETHARELAKHVPELQRAVAKIVIASAPDGKLTVPRIKQASQVLAEAVQTGGMVDIGNGQSTALSAALTVAEFEAMQRQREHINESVEKKKRDDPAGPVRVKVYLNDIEKSIAALRGEMGDAWFEQLMRAGMQV